MRICSILLLLFINIFCTAFASTHTQAIPTVTAKAIKPHELAAGGIIAKTITRHDINLSGSTTLMQILQNSGALQLRSMSGDDTQVVMSMRGFGANASSNSLLLINGIPITNPDMMPPNLSIIPVDDIESITIVPGSESVMYGDQAVGGIININTLHTTGKLNRLSCAAGSYNQHNCNFFLKNHGDTINYYFHVGVNSTDNYRDHNVFDQQAFSGQLDAGTKVNKISFDYQISNEYIQFPGALTATQVRQNRRQASNDNDFFRDTNSYLHLMYHSNINPEWQQETNIARRQMQGHGVLYSPFTQSRLSYFIKPVFKAHWQRIKLYTGASFQDDGYTLNSAFGPDNDKQQKFSLFSLINLPIKNKTRFSIGVRGAELTSRINSTTEQTYINRAFVTTIGFTKQLSSSIQGYLRRAGSYRFPNADENASTATGITGLRTQRGIAYETGMQLDRTPYTATLNIYLLNLRDEIAFDPTQTPQQPFGSNQNLAPTQRRGLSLSGKYKLQQAFTIDAQFNLVDALFRNGIYQNNRIPLVSQATIHTGVNYNFTDNWHLYLEGLFTGNQYPANDYANIAIINGGYTIYNFNLGYQKHNLSISFRINNIFNKPYYVYTVYQTTAETFYPAPERNFTLSFVWNQT